MEEDVKEETLLRKNEDASLVDFTSNIGSAWGFELVLDAQGCNAKVSDPEYITKFVKYLVDLIDMVPMREPWVDYCETRDPGKAGYTVYQLIETSNINIHFLDSGEAYVNIFSCKEFDPELAANAFALHFEPVVTKYNYLVRGVF